MDSGEATVRSHRWWIGAAVVAAAVVVLAGGGWYLLARHNSSTDPMTARAEQVMPFDLTRTTHTFTKTDTGGVENVVVNDPSDARNLPLIRSHLAKEAGLFRTGNYSDPAKIHGMDMPGLKELEAGAGRVNVTYADVPAGAQITYSSTEPGLVSAIHSWFDRQVADHGMPGMGG
jgi:hypothetical protein